MPSAALRPSRIAKNDGLRFVDDITGSKYAFLAGHAVRRIFDGDIASSLEEMPTDLMTGSSAYYR